MIAAWMANHVPVIEAKWLFSWNGWDGFALPFVIVVEDKNSVHDVKHEQAHVYQWWHGWIVGFAWDYLVALYYFGYNKNPFECLADKYARATIHIEDTWPK